MRPIIVKYQADCRKCGTTLPVGDNAIYERRVGIFCPSCAPTDPEEIRTYRQEGADRKADRLEGWADTRRKKADAQLNSFPEIRHDWAFITQPGHIPFRSRMNAADNRACESLGVAAKMQARADSLRHVRVAGDAEKKYQEKREAILQWLKVGMVVDTVIFGPGIVAKINKKTATIKNTGCSGTYQTLVDLSFLRPIKEVTK